MMDIGQSEFSTVFNFAIYGTHEIREN